MPTPFIRGGREREILALLRPHRLEAEVRDGWVLQAVRIEAQRIEVRLSREGAAQRLILTHPRAPRGEARLAAASASFHMEVRGDGELDAARTLVSAVKRNDTGGFWQEASRATAPKPADAAIPALPVLPPATVSAHPRAVGLTVAVVLIAMAALIVVVVHARWHARRSPSDSA